MGQGDQGGEHQAGVTLRYSITPVRRMPSVQCHLWVMYGCGARGARGI